MSSDYVSQGFVKLELEAHKDAAYTTSPGSLLRFLSIVENFFYLDQAWNTVVSTYTHFFDIHTLHQCKEHGSTFLIILP